MSILIVDDSKVICQLIELHLKEGGYTDLIFADSAAAAFEILCINSNKPTTVSIELILMGIVMPNIDGLAALKIIMSDSKAKDIPVIMITGNTDDNSLKLAFEAGAFDYVRKQPFSKIELLSRVKSVLRLKNELNRNIKLMGELEQVNKELLRLTQLDGLTGLANRRFFDEFIDRQWRICKRNWQPLSLILIDIDFFKRYNDFYGHLGGDECLKKVALSIKQIANRGGDLAARYGGEEFIAVLTDTPPYEAVKLAEDNRIRIEAMLRIPHQYSDVSDVVTISSGVATIIPTDEIDYKMLVDSADKALYESKELGRNRVTLAGDIFYYD